MEFVDFARAHGLLLDSVYPSDRIRRVGTAENPKKRNGAYLYLGDRGWVQRWDMGGEVIWWKDPNAKEPTREDMERWREIQRRSADELAKRQLAAADQAKKMMDEAKTAEHNYLFMKGFVGMKGLVLDDVLLIPMRDAITNRLNGLQQIWWSEELRKYEKKMTYGTKAKGSVMFIGDPEGEEVCLCEGYATGLSIHKACRSVGLNTTVVVTFSANNLTHVAQLLKRKRMWVFADNDKSGTGERVAKETGLKYAISPWEGMDANDHHRAHGLMSLCGLILKARA